MNKITLIAAGAAISATLAAGVVNAAENPFGMQKLDTGYKVAMSEGTCGEGKCGANKGKEGKCGEGKAGTEKGKEGKCGAQ